MNSHIKTNALRPLARFILVAGMSGALLACQTSSQQQSSSSSSMPSMPSSSSSSSSSPSMPSPSSSSPSSNSPSTPSTASSSSSSQPSNSSSNSSSSSPSSSSSSSSSSSTSSSSASSSSPAGSDASPSGATAGSDTAGGTLSFPAQTGGQAAGSDSSGQQTAGNSPGQTSGSESRLPGDSGDQGTGRDGATGDLSTGQSGNSGSSGGTLGAPSGDYSLETLPSGTLGGGSQQQAGTASGQTGTMTAAERAAVLDERLRRGYEDFDGFILGERERAQRESNEAGSVAIFESGGGGGSAGGDNAGQPQTLPANGAQLPSGVVSASQPTQQSSGQAESFPPPEDIPSGRDDDVVARQLREAAMSEPDPELREALWDEYRRYTGIAEGDE